MHEEIELIARYIYTSFKMHSTLVAGLEKEEMDIFILIASEVLSPNFKIKDKKVKLLKEALEEIAKDKCYNPQYVAQTTLRRLEDTI